MADGQNMRAGKAAAERLLTTREMAEADRLAVEGGTPSLTLMENVGQAVAMEAMKLVKPGATVVVLCGPGNNGGDGFVAARLLAERGYSVRVGLLGECSALKGDAAVMAARWSGAVSDARKSDTAVVDLYIDAVFGAGLSRPLDPAIGSDILSRIGETPVLAVDVPSGLDGNTGRAEGPVFTATRTVTFFRRKPGHLLMPGRAYCGEVIVADIGISESVLDRIQTTLPDGRQATTCVNDTADLHWRGHLSWPRRDGHKYSRGHAVVISGGPESTGAARLGARAALRAGAGLVTVVGSPAATMINAAQLTSVMVKSVSWPDGLAQVLADERRNAVLIGPGAGVGPETAAAVLTVLASRAAAVLDADALTSFAEMGPQGGGGSFGFLGKGTDAAPGPAELFGAITKRQPPSETRLPPRDRTSVVLTPHTGEFKRLFPSIAGQGSKLDQARAAANPSGAVVVLKGQDTIIAAPDGRAAINENAPPWLATAGSGDVLAGIVTGLLAQQMPAFPAACAAVWLHGEAGNLAGVGLIAEDLPDQLPIILARLFAARES